MSQFFQRNDIDEYSIWNFFLCKKVNSKIIKAKCIECEAELAVNGTTSLRNHYSAKHPNIQIKNKPVEHSKKKNEVNK
jgi:hypothetical protein